MKNNTIQIVALGALAYLILGFKRKGQQPTSVKRSQIMAANAKTSSPESAAKFNKIVLSMTDWEVDVVHEAFFEYLVRGWQIPPGSTLRKNLDYIGDKYGIFT